MGRKVLNPFLRLPSLGPSYAELCRAGEDLVATLGQVDTDRLDEEDLRELDQVTAPFHGYGWGD